MFASLKKPRIWIPVLVVSALFVSVFAWNNALTADLDERLHSANEVSLPMWYHTLNEDGIIVETNTIAPADGKYFQEYKTDHTADVTTYTASFVTPDGVTHSIPATVKGRVDHEWAVTEYNRLVTSGRIHPISPGGTINSLQEYVFSVSNHHPDATIVPVIVATGKQTTTTGSTELVTAFREGLSAEEALQRAGEEFFPPFEYAYSYDCQEVYVTVGNQQELLTTIAQAHPELINLRIVLPIAPLRSATVEPCGIINTSEPPTPRDNTQTAPESEEEVKENNPNW